MLAIRTLTQKSIIFRRSVRLMGDLFEISVVGNNPNWADEKIDAANISAKYENGILKVELPKKEIVKAAAQEITIQ